MSNKILSGDNLLYLEEVFEKYSSNQGLVDNSWASLFNNIDAASNRNVTTSSNKFDLLGLENILNTYRNYGHLSASLDPLGITKPLRDDIDFKVKSIKEADKKNTFYLPYWNKQATLEEIIQIYENWYCNTIGYEYFYLRNDEERTWFQSIVESERYNQTLTVTQKITLLKKLIQAESFESFLAKKYIGKKRFSLEGSESLIPLLHTVIQESADADIEGLVIGMAHRGRLNVLANIIEKPTSQIFAEFEENYNPKNTDSSDVKYHLGYSNYININNKKIKLSLMFNPSHLEAVNPVALGSVRARQTILNDTERNKILGILIHGDASFIGQGVVAETLNLSNLNGFTTGGTLHIVVNNQIGFTTLPNESRSTLYATDLAKAFQIPILHVNGNDPEAVFRSVKLSMAYRQRYKKDVIIDLISYRKLGHNESDEPEFTQPKMYKIIKQKKSIASLYEQQILQQGITKESIKTIKEEVSHYLSNSFKATHEDKVTIKVDTMQERWAAYTRASGLEPSTDFLKHKINTIIKALTNIPNDFQVHRKLLKFIEQRKLMGANKALVDWSFAEALAVGSILISGHPVRFVGQDSERGTFSHRHIVLQDTQTEKKWIALNHINTNQAKLEIINSPLSEFSVMGYEYGYSLSYPDSLVIWEAQFGDFVNGAQVIIDQFIASSEVKWLRMSGLVLLLPHGYEGQGPEHSSARLERFLHLCAKNNIQVCNVTQTSQYFHLLRRQALRKDKKPLIIMTPKSLLRDPNANSNLKEFIKGHFHKVIDDPRNSNVNKVKYLAMCSGKIYYDVEKALLQSKQSVQDKIALIRIEQLYPYPYQQINEIIQKYTHIKAICWVQEEPKNMGAWFFMEEHLKRAYSKLKILNISRPSSSSPAVGLHKIHLHEHEDIIKTVVNLP